VVDALDRVGRDAQAHVAAERVRDERHVAQVRQETPLGLDVGVADLVADQGALGRQFATPRHVEKSSSSPGSPMAPVGGLNRCPSRERRTYRGERAERQGFRAFSSEVDPGPREENASKTRIQGSVPI
jgi:hypothetical protein